MGVPKNFIWIAFAGAIGASLYPIWFGPWLDPSSYQKIQKLTREGIEQDKIQPGNMRVWSDPFERRD